MNSKALSALQSLDDLTKLVVSLSFGFDGRGARSPQQVATEMGLCLSEVDAMLEQGLRFLAGYKARKRRAEVVKMPENKLRASSSPENESKELSSPEEVRSVRLRKQA